MAKDRRGLLDFAPEILAQDPPGPQAEGVPGNGAPLPHRTGAVRDMAHSIQLLQADSDRKAALEEALQNGETVVSLDPDLFDPSPIRDRIEDSTGDLVASIRDQGQQVPILARVHPDDPERYQIAFGHRRLEVCRGLGIKVKAIIRKEISAEEMAIAQGQENSARQDLSYIELARFVARLKERFPTPVVAAASGLDKTAIYKMEGIVKNIPDELILAIGRAPKIGRPRWEKFADALKNEDLVRKALAAAHAAASKGRETDGRFEAAYEALRVREEPSTFEVKEGDRTIASRRTSAKGDSLVIKETAFLEHVMAHLPDLYRQYRARIAEPPAGPFAMAAE